MDRKGLVIQDEKGHAREDLSFLNNSMVKFYMLVNNFTIQNINFTLFHEKVLHVCQGYCVGKHKWPHTSGFLSLPPSLHQS